MYHFSYEDEECDDDEDDMSLTSTHTLTNEKLNDLDNPAKKKGGGSVCGTIKPKRLDCGSNNNKKSKLHKSLHINDASESDAKSRTGSEYSPPSINSMSLPPTPSDTPVPVRKVGKYGLSLETKSMNGRSSSNKGKLHDVSPVREEDVSETGDKCTKVRIRKPKTLSASNIALTNVRVSLSFKLL